jgi:transcriptional regulator CtsR
MKVFVILSEAKDLQFQSAPGQCRFFASLRMTGRKGFSTASFRTAGGH